MSGYISIKKFFLRIWLSTNTNILDLAITYNNDELFCPCNKMSNSECGINYAVGVFCLTLTAFLMPNSKYDNLV